MQETLARVICRIREGSLNQEDVAPYAYRVAGNLIVDGYRAQRREFVELSETLPATEPSPEHLASVREEYRAVRKTLQQMPALRRQVFTLVRVEGLSHAEVSARLGLSGKAIEKHMSRALADLIEDRRKRQMVRPAAGHSGGFRRHA